MISNFSRGGHFYAFNCAFYIEDFLNEHGISAEQECSNEALTEDTLKSDVGSIKPTLADQTIVQRNSSGMDSCIRNGDFYDFVESVNRKLMDEDLAAVGKQ